MTTNSIITFLATFIVKISFLLETAEVNYECLRLVSVVVIIITAGLRKVRQLVA
jgi:hypothetical protein